MNEEIVILAKLYDYQDEKPELSEETLAHFGVKGMRWGHRKDRKSSGSGRVKKNKPKRMTKKQKKAAREAEIKKMSKEDIIKKKDVEAMNKRSSEFSNNEINEVLNRINTEQRLSAMAKQKSQSKVKQTLSSPEFKKIAAISLVSLPLVIYGAKTLRYTSKANRSKLGPIDPITKNPAFVLKGGVQKPTTPNMDSYTRSMAQLLFGISLPKSKK